MCCRQNGNGFCRWWPQTPPSLQIDQAKHAKHCSFSATGLKSLQLLILLSKLTFSIVSLNLTETQQSFPIYTVLTAESADFFNMLAETDRHKYTRYNKALFAAKCRCKLNASLYQPNLLLSVDQGDTVMLITA